MSGARARPPRETRAALTRSRGRPRPAPGPGAGRPPAPREQLEAYARAGDRRHLPAWRDFNRVVRDSGEVGIFHETYRVGPGRVESVYGNMPRVGLAAATSHTPVGRVAQSAGARMDPSAADDPAVEPY